MNQAFRAARYGTNYHNSAGDYTCSGKATSIAVQMKASLPTPGVEVPPNMPSSPSPVGSGGHDICTCSMSFVPGQANTAIFASAVPLGFDPKEAAH